MGDFNIDMIDSKSNRLQALLSRFGLSNDLAENTSTTINGTQIDIVFSNSRGTAGTYETYFSDHKPVYLTIMKDGKEGKCQKAEKSVKDVKEPGKDDEESHKNEKSDKKPRGNSDKNDKREGPEHPEQQRNAKNYDKDGEGEKVAAEREAKDKGRDPEPEKNADNEDGDGGVVDLTVKPDILITDEEREAERRAFFINQLQSTLPLTDDTIMHFIELINTNTQYSMQNVNFYQYYDPYIRNPQHLDDIQILFGITPGADVLASLGHWICVHFRSADNTLYVYDSLYSRSLYARQQEIIRVIYPYIDLEVDVVFVRPYARQNDISSCGVFALAYAISIIFERDPAALRLRLGRRNNNISIHMRNHLLQILALQELSEFPTE